MKSNKSISQFFLAKFHFLQFQKWPKINFWMGKKVLNCQKCNFHCTIFPLLAQLIYSSFPCRPLSRSVTTPSLPGRGRTTTSKVTSSTRPKLPDQAGGSNKSGVGNSGSASLPFGSTSSISSSSSSRSWADTVKGLKTPRSVEETWKRPPRPCVSQFDQRGSYAKLLSQS